MNRKSCPEHLRLLGASLQYWPDYLDADRALRLFAQLRDQLPWEQPRIRVYGKWHLVPRLSLWMGDPLARYRYSGQVFVPHPWLPAMRSLCDALNAQLAVGFNSVLVNYYRNGTDVMGFHADNEPELGPDPTIACISLGAARDLRFRHGAGLAPSFNQLLDNGSLLVMGPGTQRHWLHGLPKRANAGPRISLTFRRVVTSIDHISGSA